MDFLGYDTVNGRAYTGSPQSSGREINVDASRWRLQLGSAVFFLAGKAEGEGGRASSVLTSSSFTRNSDQLSGLSNASKGG